MSRRPAWMLERVVVAARVEPVEPARVECARPELVRCARCEAESPANVDGRPAFKLVIRARDLGVAEYLCPPCWRAEPGRTG